MDFDKSKKDCLEKLYLPDKSKKGYVDEAVIELIDLINSHDDFYTTSSCAGRINLFTDNQSAVKADANWLLVSHEKIFFDDVKKALNNLPDSTVWFRQEALIIHICTRSYETAVSLLKFAQNNGFKHAGIIAATKRFIVELIGTQRIDAPIALNGKLLVDDNYLNEMTQLANSNLDKVHAQIKRTQIAFKKEFF